MIANENKKLIDCTEKEYQWTNSRRFLKLPIPISSIDRPMYTRDKSGNEKKRPHLVCIYGDPTWRTSRIFLLGSMHPPSMVINFVIPSLASSRRIWGRDGRRATLKISALILDSKAYRSANMITFTRNYLYRVVKITRTQN